jgi:hypothetical protein
MRFTNFDGFTIIPNTLPIYLRGFDSDASDAAAASFVVPIVAWVIQHERDREGVRVDLTARPISVDDFPVPLDPDAAPRVYCYETVLGGATTWLFPNDRAFTSLAQAVAYGVEEQRKADARQNRSTARVPAFSDDDAIPF